MDNIMSRLFEDILRKIVLLLWGAALLMAGCSESDPATEGLGAVPDGEVEFVFDLSAARAAIGEDGSGACMKANRGTNCNGAGNHSRSFRMRACPS